MARKVHSFGHARPKEMAYLMERQGMVRTQSGRHDENYSNPVQYAPQMESQPTKMISTTNINVAFNEKIQTDFVYFTIHDKNHEVINIMDLGTKYGEKTLTESRSADEVRKYFKTYWFLKQDAAKKFSADHELGRPILTHFLNLQKIILNPRPSRSSHKTGRIEHNNGVFASVINKLLKADTSAIAEISVGRSSFPTNLIRGSKYMNDFQKEKGYTPLIFGIPREMVRHGLSDAHVDRESTGEI